MSISQRPKWVTGAAAGIFTVLWFTALHHVLISNIWFSLIPMLIAGALCGGSLAWNYQTLFPSAAPRTWFAFTGIHLLSLLLLAVASLAMFEPMVPIAVLLAANEPPTELIGQAVPLTIFWILATAVVTSALWGQSIGKFLASLVTAAVLTVLLGLNVSVLGLVEMSAGSFEVIGLFLGLIVLIMAGYGGVFFVAELAWFKPVADRSHEFRAQPEAD